MDTTYWSRRRVLTVLGAATAATSIPLAAPSRALAAVGASSVGDLPKLPELPDTARAKAVTAWKVGGPTVKLTGARALAGSATDIDGFLAEGLAKATAEDNRRTVLGAMALSGRGMATPPRRHWRPARRPSPPFWTAGSRPPSSRTCASTR